MPTPPRYPAGVVDEDRFDDEPEAEDFEQEWAPPPPRPVGTALGAAMVGLHNAIYGEKEEAAIVMEAAGAPPNDDFDLELDPDNPAASRVVVKRKSESPPPE